MAYRPCKSPSSFFPMKGLNESLSISSPIFLRMFDGIRLRDFLAEFKGMILYILGLQIEFFFYLLPWHNFSLGNFTFRLLKPADDTGISAENFHGFQPSFELFLGHHDDRRLITEGDAHMSTMNACFSKELKKLFSRLCCGNGFSHKDVRENVQVHYSVHALCMSITRSAAQTPSPFASWLRRTGIQLHYGRREFFV